MDNATAAILAGALTAVITAGATLLGVGLTQRHATTMRRLDRHEEHRIEQRKAVADVLVTGREWVSSLESVMLVAGLLSDSIVFSQSLAVDKHGPIRTAHSGALVTARLVIRDSDVLTCVRRLSDLVAQMPEHISRVQEDAQRGGKASPEALGEGLREARRYTEALDGLEQLTRDRIVDDPPAR